MPWFSRYSFHYRGERLPFLDDIPREDRSWVEVDAHLDGLASRGGKIVPLQWLSVFLAVRLFAQRVESFRDRVESLARNRFAADV